MPGVRKASLQEPISETIIVIADDYAPPSAKSKWLAAFYLCIPVGYALVRKL